MTTALIAVVGTLAGVVIGGILNRSGQKKLWLRQQRLAAYGEFSALVSAMTMLYLRQRNNPRPQEEWRADFDALLHQAHDVEGRLNLIATPRVNRTSKVLLTTLLQLDPNPEVPLPAEFDGLKNAFINACQDDLVSLRWWKPWTLHRITRQRGL